MKFETSFIRKDNVIYEVISVCLNKFKILFFGQNLHEQILKAFYGHIKHFIGIKSVFFLNIIYIDDWLTSFFVTTSLVDVLGVLIKLCKIVALFSSLEADVGRPLRERFFTLSVSMKHRTILTNVNLKLTLTH